MRTPPLEEEVGGGRRGGRLKGEEAFATADELIDDLNRRSLEVPFAVTYNPLAF